MFRRMRKAAWLFPTVSSSDFQTLTNSQNFMQTRKEINLVALKIYSVAKGHLVICLFHVTCPCQNSHLIQIVPLSMSSSPVLLRHDKNSNHRKICFFRNERSSSRLVEMQSFISFGLSRNTFQNSVTTRRFSPLSRHSIRDDYCRQHNKWRMTC